MTIKIKDFSVQTDNAGILTATLKMISDTALTASTLAQCPTFRLDAYNQAGVLINSTNPVSFNHNGLVVTADANTPFDVVKQVSLLAFAQGLPSEQELNIKVIATIKNGILQVEKPLIAKGKTKTWTFDSTICTTNRLIAREPLSFPTANDAATDMGINTANVLTTIDNDLYYGRNDLNSVFKSNFSTYTKTGNTVQSVAPDIAFINEGGTKRRLSTSNITTIADAITANIPFILTTLDYIITEFKLFNDLILGTVNNKKFTSMDLTKQEFIEIAQDVLSISETNTMRIECLLISFTHNDTANEKVIPLSNEAHQTIFIKKINVAIAADGTTFSLKINNKENAVTSTLQIVPEGIEGNYEAAGYFASEVIVKGNITGQIIIYRATKL